MVPTISNRLSTIMSRNQSAASVSHRKRKKIVSATIDVDVPFHKPLILITLVAIVSPIATLSYYFYHYTHHHHPHQSFNKIDDIILFPTPQYHQHNRYLQIDCNINSTTTIENEAIEWSAIQLTSIIASVVAFFCLLGFELFRRDPIVGKYVYDRKRLSQPGRSPPPLMLSRSLWRGYDNDDDEDENNNNDDGEQRKQKHHTTTCCKNVRPAILELLFLNLDQNYIRYSHAADEARKERERRGYYETCCRRGCYHNNCCSNHSRRRLINTFPDVDFTVDEDGYLFYPGYLNDYSHIYQSGNDGRYSSYTGKKKDIAPSLPADDELEVPKWQKNITDLFPEDNVSSFLKEDGQSLVQYDNNKSVECIEAESQENNNENPTLGEETKEEYETLIEDDTRCKRSPNSSCSRSEEKEEMIGLIKDIANKGSDLSSASNDAPTTIKGGGQNMEKDDNETTSLPIENNTIRQHNLSNRSNVAVRDDEERTETVEGVTSPELKYPSRLKYIFMPPGFHTWGNAFRFIGFFFLLPNFSRWCQKMASKLPTSPLNREVETAQENRRLSVPLTNPGKDLSEGEQELLRCAGLDTYLLVRLARFGFDVCVSMRKVVLPLRIFCVSYPTRFWSSQHIVVPIFDSMYHSVTNLSYFKS